MKVLDSKNAPARLKAFLIWGGFLAVVEFISSLIFYSFTNALLYMAAINIIASVFAGFKVASSLKGKTGDNHSSAIYGAIVPVFASGILFVVNMFFGVTHFNFPLLPMLAGLIGGFISQRKK